MTLFWAKMPYQTYQLSGEDARNFLQGQITQDIRKITADTCHYGAYCNPKGRMFANLLLFADSDHIFIRLHESIAETVVKRLQMFMLRAKVRIERSPHVNVGLSAAAAKHLCEQLSLDLPAEFHTVSTDGLILCHLPNGYYEAQCTPESTVYQILKDIPQDDDHVMATFMSGGHFDVTDATIETLLPQQTSLATWGGISYTKGCYVGQEIIARNKYLGKVKNTLAVATTAPETKLAVGDSVLHDNKNVGKIIAVHVGKRQNLYQSIMAIDSLHHVCTVGEQTITFQPIQTNEST